jgi:hypothetical protein
VSAQPDAAGDLAVAKRGLNPPRRTPLLETESQRGKKIAKILQQIQDVPGLSEDERYLFARSLAASPDQRWRLHENFLRSHDLFTRSSRKKYGVK